MLHYHGTPCGGPRVDVGRFLKGRHALIPFPRPEDIGTAAEVCQSFILDNGAYTAWKQGQPVADWTAYYEFVEFWHRHPGMDWAIIPDVIDGSESDNDRLIEEWPRNLPGVPVWHLHESLERLDDLVTTWPRICLGSSGEYRTPGLDAWVDRMDEAMEIICDSQGRPRCKLHGLRMLDPAIYHQYPLSSADSTNAVRNANQTKRFGMYPPPTHACRMDTIASRSEFHNSAAIWVPKKEQQKYLVFKLTTEK